MLRVIDKLPRGVYGVRAEGKVTREDYETVLNPLLEEARRKGERIRFLYRFGPEFESFTGGAAFEDARVGMQHLRLFERCAIVSDIGWIRESSKLVGSLMPCPVRVFGNEEWTEAVTWVSSSSEGAQLSHRLLPEAGVLLIEPKGRLRVEDFDAVSLTVDPWIETEGTLNGLVIHAHDFPGWENFGSFVRHLQFVRDHHRKVKRIALAVDGDFAKIASGLGEHFVEAKVERFPYDALDKAIAWASTGSE
jgi:hypothetical protein